MHASDLLRVPLRRWYVFLPIACLGPAVFLLARGGNGEPDPGWLAATRLELGSGQPPGHAEDSERSEAWKSRAVDRIHSPLETARVEWDVSLLLTGKQVFESPALQGADCASLLAKLEGVFPSDPQALHEFLGGAIRIHIRDPSPVALPVEVVARRQDPDEALLLSWAYAEALRLSHQRFLRSIASSVGSEEDVAQLTAATRAVAESGPNRSPLQLIAAISLLLAWTAALSAERRDQFFVDPSSASAQLGLPLLGVIPGTAGKCSEFARGDVHSAVMESVHDSAGALRQLAREQETSSFAFASAVPGEGKSSLLCNLARTLARKGLRVLVVDADVRAPSLHKLLGVENSRGLGDLLNALGQDSGDTWARIEAIEKMLAAVRQPTSTERLTVITAGSPPKGRRSPIEVDDLRPLALRLARDADIVLYDTSALSTRFDALDVGRAVERTVLVVDALKAQKKETQRAKRLLVDGQATVAGMLFNRAHPKHCGAILRGPTAPSRQHSKPGRIQGTLTNAGA